MPLAVATEAVTGGRRFSPTSMRITADQALDMLRSDDLVGVGMEADAVRARLHPGGVVTYQIDRNINYTNVCTEYCSFCAFYRPVGSPEGYVQPLESIFQKIDETLALGGTGVLMQGGLHPDLKMDYYENLLRAIKARYPQLHLHCLSAPEILNIAEICGITVRQVISRLMQAGIDSIPGTWAASRDNTSLGNFIKQEVTAVDYLKTLAVSRVYLDNILNVQASWLTPGHKICQIALRFGGNDVGSILIEENVVSAAGCHNKSTEAGLRQMISDAGFRPIRRDTLYRTYFLN